MLINPSNASNKIVWPNFTVHELDSREVVLQLLLTIDRLIEHKWI